MAVPRKVMQAAAPVRRLPSGVIVFHDDPAGDRTLRRSVQPRIARAQGRAIKIRRIVARNGE